LHGPLSSGVFDVMPAQTLARRSGFRHPSVGRTARPGRRSWPTLASQRPRAVADVPWRASWASPVVAGSEVIAEMASIGDVALSDGCRLL